MIRIEIFSQGEEVVSGQTVDTNAAWLSRQLVATGFDVTRHTCVGDRLEELVPLLREIGVRADYCICSGGLGPTEDDLTAEAVARAFGCPLQEDPEALVFIERCFSRWGRAMPEVNRKQAWLPRGAQRLDNHWGTAPGFALQADKCHFAFVPGVPSEMRHLFSAYVEPDLKQRFDPIPWSRVTLRTVGIGESDLQERLNAIALPKKVVVSFRAGLPEIHTKLFFPPGFPDDSRRHWVTEAASAIGRQVFSIDGLDGPGGSLPEVIGQALSARNESLAVVETASSGLIASQCAGWDWFLESTVIQDRDRLAAMFDLPAPVADDAPSARRTVKRLAEVAQARAASDYGLAQFGSFDRAALHDPDRSVRLHHALAAPTGLFYEAGSARGPLQRKKTMAATLALDMLRRYLQNCL